LLGTNPQLRRHIGWSCNDAFALAGALDACGAGIFAKMKSSQNRCQRLWNGLDARLAVAKQYVTASVADMDIPHMITPMWKPMVPQIEASTGKLLSDEKLKAIEALYLETCSGPMQEIMTNLIQGYGRYLDPAPN
jgi:hypothetical protein